MSQEESYWALRLPHGWCVFGLDNALSNDIDALQFQYFARVRWLPAACCCDVDLTNAVR